MGLWGFIKAIFGHKEEEPPDLYNPPFVVLPQKQAGQSGSYWDQMKKRWDARMEWERERRSRYGGGG